MAIAFDVQIVGDALNSQGFVAFNTIEGLGLNTFGFLWPIEGIWTVCSDCDVTSTTWTECPCDEGALLP
jgi:hypothetical protein